MKLKAGTFASVFNSGIKQKRGSNCGRLIKKVTTDAGCIDLPDTLNILIFPGFPETGEISVMHFDPCATLWIPHTTSYLIEKNLLVLSATGCSRTFLSSMPIRGIFSETNILTVPGCV